VRDVGKLQIVQFSGQVLYISDTKAYFPVLERVLREKRSCPEAPNRSVFGSGFIDF